MLDLREYIYDMPQVMAAADLIICRAAAANLAVVDAAERIYQTALDLARSS